jgi:hypothetical protein
MTDTVIKPIKAKVTFVESVPAPAPLAKNNLDLIIVHHNNAVGLAINTVKEAAKAGDLLVKERDARSGSFKTWVEEYLPFARKTAYQYIRIAENVTSGILNLADVSSIRGALKLCNTADGTEPKRAKDKRVETIPSLCARINAAYTGAKSDKPLHGWDDEEIDALRTSLKGIVDIYLELGDSSEDADRFI